MFLITDKPIDVAAALAAAARPEDGAVATFMGMVRNHSNGTPVRELFYETYAPMALKSFEEIGRQVKSLWKVSGLTIIHRTGRLCPGDMAVLVVATSEHRRDALEACARAIERIKQISPIWKKEFGGDGSQAWVEQCAAPREEHRVLV